MAVALLESCALPFLFTFLLYWTAEFVLSGAGERFAALASGIAGIVYLVAHGVILSVPPFPPAGPTQAVFYAVLVGLVFGGATDLMVQRQPERLVRVFCLFWPLILALWIGWDLVTAFDPLAMFGVVALWAGGAIALIRLEGLRSDNPRGLKPGVIVVAAAGGAGVLGLYFAAAAVGRVAFAAGAAFAAILLWNWGALFRSAESPRPLGRAGLFAGATAVLALVDVLGLHTDTSFLLLIVLSTVVFADLVAGDRPRGAGRGARTMRPFIAFVIALVPVLLLQVIVFGLSIITQV